MSALPRSCVPVPKIEQDCYDWYARHADKTAWVQANRAEVVFIGDSLTHFWEGGPTDHDYGEGLWSETFAGRPVLNLGYGYDRTQNVLWRLEHGELAGQTPKLIILNIGTNHCSISPNYDGDTPEVAVTGVAAVVAKLHEMCPEAHLVVMALFPRGGKLSFISAANALLREKAAAWDFADLVDLTHRLGDGQGEPVARFRKPKTNNHEPLTVNREPLTNPQESDEFDGGVLGKQWQWHANYSPLHGMPTARCGSTPMTSSRQLPPSLTGRVRRWVSGKSRTCSFRSPRPPASRPLPRCASQPRKKGNTAAC